MKDSREMWALRLTPEEKRQLKIIAKQEGVTMSAMVRLLVRRSYERRAK